MKTPSWFLDELSHAGSEHLDPAYVPQYDRKAGTDPAADMALLREYGLNTAHTLVDLGAGSGTFTLTVAPHCRQVIAVDVSPVMLALVQQKASELGIENITYAQHGFLTYAHQGEQADYIYSRHALHHLPDFWKALALTRIAAYLRTGGILFLRDLIFSCELHELTPVVDAWLAGASTNPEQGWTRAELETHLREEHSTFSWLLEPMLERAGFEIRHIEHDRSRVRSGYVCVKR